MTNIYQTLYNLIQTYLFSGATSGSYEELMTIIVATIGTLTIVVLPFLIVWKIFKVIGSI